MTPKKQNPDRTHGEKLISLFAKLLFTGKRHSTTELAKTLECSKQTVARLVDSISRAYAVEIREEQVGNRKFYSIPRLPNQDPAALISESELRTLLMCRSFAQHLLGKDHFVEATRAVEKNYHVLGADAEDSDAFFGVFRSGVIDYTPQSEILRCLIQCMDKRKVCRISYRKLSARRPKTYFIKPLKIFSHRENIYVHGRQAKEPGKPFKTPKYDPLFALHRFKSAEKTDTSYRMPTNYDFNKALNKQFGVWQSKPFKVEARFTGWAADYVAERTWSPDQKMKRTKADLKLNFSSTSEHEVLALILSFGPHARLIAPETLVQRIAGMLAETSGLYKGG